MEALHKNEPQFIIEYLNWESIKKYIGRHSIVDYARWRQTASSEVVFIRIRWVSELVQY